MLTYITRRILQMIPVLFGASIIIFVVVSLAPGNYYSSKANNLSQEKIEQLEEAQGLNDPLPVRYVNWFKDTITGDFGESLRFKEPVIEVIDTYIWNSFYLSAAAFIASILIAVPIGIVSATKQYSLTDGFFTVLALLGISLPSFFIGLLLIKTFAFDLKLFPIGGMKTTASNYTGIQYVLDVMKHMFLPFLVLTLTQIGSLMRYTRTSMLEVIRQDYIRTARAKGLKESVVIYKHALRNAMIPIVTVLSLSIPGLFAGSIITERIFAWPGIGKIALEALTARDYPFLMAFNVMIATLTLIGSLIADLSYALVDPRVRLK